MKHLLTAIVWCAALTQAATKPKTDPPPAPVVAPTLTATEQIAINTVSQQQADNQRQAAQLQQEAAAVLADIARAHPGYHLGADGKLAPDAKPDPLPPAPTAPDPRPKPPAQ